MTDRAHMDEYADMVLVETLSIMVNSFSRCDTAEPRDIRQPDKLVKVEHVMRHNDVKLIDFETLSN